MRLFVSILLIVNFFVSYASHIVGGEIYYDYLGNNQYRFYISVYRDCNSTGAGFDNPLKLTIYDQNNNLFQNIDVPFPGDNNVPVVFNNPCVTPPNNICTENALYTTVVTLPPTPGGYTISYQRCCRGPNISNISFPDDTGFTLTCQVPGNANNNYINSSPRFNDYPPLLLCNNEDLIFDHSATDPDGDQLVYSLFTPYTGASSASPAPNTAPPPPYSNVVWLNGYSTPNPLGPGATISIDPNTGLLTASPNLTGLFVVGIQVQELRNGVVINSTKRDFLFRVFNCDIQMQAILPLQTELPDFVSYCQGLTINFENNSYGGTNYSWDFGVPGTNTDVSTDFEPSFTYPANGSYQAMLVVNPGWACTDTAYIDILVNNEIEVSFTSEDSLCVLDNNFNFIGSTTGPPGTTWQWDFGPNANQQTASTQNVPNIHFNQAGQIPVTAEVFFSQCSTSVTNTITVIPEPTAEMVLSENIECEGLTVDFGNSTLNATNYEWNFGDGNTSTDFEPMHTYLIPGDYTITLSSWSSPTCTNTTQETITVNEKLEIDFTSEDSLCLTDNVFNFDGTVSGPPHSVYTWNFGPNASIQSSNDIDVPNVTFNTTGSIPITLTGTFDHCVESLTKEIYIFSPPTIDFALAPGLQCVPFEGHFIDLSTSETPLFYHWDFGDGNTSSAQNPTNVFTEVGHYPIELTIWTTSGCVDTLTLLKQDIVNVRPNPTAGFNVDPDYTDICNSLVNFTDESSGATEWHYWFDDGNTHSYEQSPVHTYLYDGGHRPRQIVHNEWGCSDTAYQELFIEPFTIYAPTAFTPDGNKFNNTWNPVIYLEAKEWHLQIYDRWGHIVFESKDPNIGWDGTGVNGRLMQSGTYTWKLHIITCEPLDPDKTLTGLVNLLR